MRWTVLKILQLIWILFLLAFAVTLLVACSSNKKLILGPADGPCAEKCLYLFNNVSQLNSDTMVTWTLGFVHYENGVGGKGFHPGNHFL